MTRTCVWLHDAAIHPDNPALKSSPDAAVLFVFDEPYLRDEPQAYHRVAFQFASVRELFAELPHPIKEIRLGDPVAEIVAFCAEHDCDAVHVVDSAMPGLRGVIEQLSRGREVRVYPRDQLATYDEEPRSFNRYWRQVGKQVLGYPPAGGRKMR